MRRPSTFRLAGHDFKLEFTDAETLRTGAEGPSGTGHYAGLFLELEARLLIHDKCPPGVQQRICFHELVHAADAVGRGDGMELSEGQVDRVAVNLFSVLRDNPRLRDWLFAEVDA